jgi:uncharacterized membrane protein YjjP (DUF1212 family)
LAELIVTYSGDFAGSYRVEGNLVRSQHSETEDRGKVFTCVCLLSFQFKNKSYEFKVLKEELQRMDKIPTSYSDIYAKVMVEITSWSVKS